jgi:hypothetical protein
MESHNGGLPNCLGTAAPECASLELLFGGLRSHFYSFDRPSPVIRRCGCLQEDAHVAKLNLGGYKDRGFFGIFDGHGGAQVAKFCAKHMPDLFLQSEEFRRGDIEAALVAAYLGIDEKLRDPANAEELNRMKAKSSANSNGAGLESVDQQESVGSGAVLNNKFMLLCTSCPSAVGASLLHVSASTKFLHSLIHRSGSACMRWSPGDVVAR